MCHHARGFRIAKAKCRFKNFIAQFHLLGHLVLTRYLLDYGIVRHDDTMLLVVDKGNSTSNHHNQAIQTSSLNGYAGNKTTLDYIVQA
jgi:hypothetical protein